MRPSHLVSSQMAIWLQLELGKSIYFSSVFLIIIFSADSCLNLLIYHIHSALSAMIFGSIAFALVWAATCLNLGRRSWRSIAFLSLVTTICQGCVFLVLRTDFCTAGRNPLEAITPHSATCELGKSGKVAILAVCLWFTATVGAMFVSIKAPDSNPKRKSKISTMSISQTMYGK